MKTLKLFITLSLALFISGGLMAQLTITVTNHVEGSLSTEISSQLAGQALTDITGLIISGETIDMTDVTDGIKSCTNLVTLDVSGVTFAGNITPSVTSSSSGMCNGLQKLETVVLPNTLKEIGTYAFYSCPELKNVNLNDDITAIHQNAFMLCKKLNITSLPANLVTIGSSSFAQSNVTLTELPETVKTIAGSAFSKCSNVTISELPSGLTRLDSRAFELTPVTISKLPSGLAITTIPERVFDRTSIVNFTIPETIASIGNLAFYANDNDPLGHSGSNPVRDFICRSASLPSLGTTVFGPAATSNNTTVHILKKATGAAAYTTAGVTIAYLTQNITVTISGSGTVSVSGTAVDAADQGQVSSGSVVKAYEAEKITFTFTPDGGNVVSSAKLEEDDITSGQEIVIDSESAKTLSVTFGVASGLNAVDADNDISIFPNPVTDFVTVKGNLTTPVLLFDNLGRQILKTNESTIDMSGFASGIYFIKANRKTVKVVK